jgi:hypothetical protein
MSRAIKRGLVLLGFLGFACQKKEPRSPDHDGCTNNNSKYYLDSDLKQFKYLKNTFWVYVDSVSLNIDSTFVDSILYTGFIEISANNCIDGYNEEYFYRVKKTLAPFYDSVLVEAGFNDVRRWNGTKVSGIYYEYNKTANNTSYSAGDTIFKRDSMFIYDRYYKQVILFSHKADVNEGNLKTIYYANSAFGLLRKDVFYSNGSPKNKFLLKNKSILR